MYIAFKNKVSMGHFSVGSAIAGYAIFSHLWHKKVDGKQKRFSLLLFLS